MPLVTFFTGTVDDREEAITGKGILSRLAHVCSSRPKTVLVLWLVGIVYLFFAGQNGATSLENSDILISGTKSAKAVELEKKYFGESQSLVVLLKGDSKALDKYGPKTVQQIDRIKEVSVLSPWSQNAPGLLRPKESQALLVLQVAQPMDVTGMKTIPSIRRKMNKVLPNSVSSHVTGSAALNVEMNKVGFKAAKDSEKLAIPVLLVILLLVFRSPIAALIPALLGFSVITCGGGMIALLSRVISIDAMATTMMSMMGLALGIDYSLLIVSRFREEFAAGRSMEEALEKTAATAGRTVMFAGLVLILAMLASLWIAPGDMMMSATAGVLGAAFLAMVGSATLLPALLSVLAPYLERWRIGRKSPKTQVSTVIKRLIKRPVVTTAAVLIPLLILSSPALGLEIGAPAATALPEGNIVKRDFEEIRDTVGSGWAALFTVIAVSEDGPMSKKERLSKLDKFQKKLAKEEGVGSVLGPAALNKQSRKLQKASKDLSSGRESISNLEKGLTDAQRGMGGLRKGLAKASGGAESLEQGLGKSLEGSQSLQGAVDDSTSGSKKLQDSIADARAGAKKIASASKEVEKGSAQVKDASKDFSAELAGGRDNLEGLRKASADATNELTLALAALDRTSAATKSDPQFAEAYQRAATALGTLTGQHPKSGRQQRSGYYGMESSIARATEQNIAASKEADNLASGATDLYSGVIDLRKGTDSLISGMDDIYSGSGSLTSGLEKTRVGTGEASSGTGTLKEGAGQLASQLGDGYTQSAGLEYGLERMSDDVGQYQTSHESSGTAEQQSKMANSGYFLLAGIDSGDSRGKESASFALNWEEGGSSSRIMVVPGSGNTAEDNAVAGPQVMTNLDKLNTRLNNMTPKLAKDIKADTAVGGRGAVLNEFVKKMKNQLFPLLMTLILVAFIILTVVFRSPLLAFKAILLNMLTVGAAFGVLQLVSSGSDPLIGGPGYLNPISVSGVLTIVFALSIDYEVFLITRMREGYLKTGTTDGAIAYGLDHTARVVTGAAAIMIGVFIAFSLSDYMSLREFGVGLTVAVFLDATAVRLVLLPATMRLFGRANWWMPKWLDKILPNVAVEGGVK